MNFLNRSRIDDRNAKALLAESYNELSHQFSTFTQLQEVGNYKILRQIGEGSFGKVFLAIHKLLHTKVVLKQGKKDDPNVVREVYYQREFKHPNITKLYEVIVTDCFIYMCIEWCPEGELYDHLIKFKRIPIPKIKKCFSQLCGSVYYIHQLNSCHRDLKLENILLDKKKNVKLSDFGFTREIPGKKDSNALLPQQNTMLETICGTTVYMAPELIKREPYSGVQIDMWSLGVILYTITYGGMPFDEDDELKTKYKIIHGEPSYREDVPSDMIELMKFLLQKDPHARPQSLAQVLQHSFLEGYGTRQLEIVDLLLTKPTKPFQTKLEKNLLKKIGKVHIYTKDLVESVNEHKSDSLCGIWELMLEKERKSELQKRRKLSRSRSVLRLSQAISTNSPRGPHSRKSSFNTTTLAQFLANDENEQLNVAGGDENDGYKTNLLNFDSYSQTLNEEPNNNNNNSINKNTNTNNNISPSKSGQSSTRVNTATSSHHNELSNGKKRVSSLESTLDSISTTKKKNILRKLSKFWASNKKGGKKDDLDLELLQLLHASLSAYGSEQVAPQPSTPTRKKQNNELVETDLPQQHQHHQLQQQQQLEQQLHQQPLHQQQQQRQHQQQQQGQQEASDMIPESVNDIQIELQTPPSMTRRYSGSNNLRSVRPASMISSYSSYSHLSAMSETSLGSGNITTSSTNDTSTPTISQYTPRPMYSRARSSDYSDFFLKSSNGKYNNEPISSNSSTTNISRTTSVDSSRSNSIKNRGRVKQLKKNNNFFIKRGKSPLGQSNKFLINKRKMGLLNSKKPTASVIQEEYESSLSNSTSNLSLNENNSLLLQLLQLLQLNPIVSDSFNHTFELDIDDDDGDYFARNEIKQKDDGESLLASSPK